MTDVLATDPTTIAAEFAHAIATGDRGALRGRLADEVDFKAVTPGRAWESRSADEVVGTILDTWFGGQRRIDSVECTETDTFADIVRVGYRFRASTPTGPALVEQQAYLTVADGTITSVRIVCSGYRALPG
ncbi:MAG TPA: hypothetical protein VM030_01030 [Acidimicrobiales bacterium]|nr:hypothetical protein [Acidimicrobiales bacterium]